MLRFARHALKNSRPAASSRTAFHPPHTSVAAARFNSTQTPRTPSEGSTLLSKSDEHNIKEWEEDEAAWEEEPPYPDLMQRDPLIDDINLTEVFPAGPDSPHTNTVIWRNEDPLGGKWEEEPPEEKKTDSRFEFLHTSRFERSNWHQYVLMHRRVSQQTGKGKKHRMSYLYVVGDGNGLLGCGTATDAEPTVAMEKAIVQAYRNVDYVDRMENRTLWTEMESKHGSTRIILRPRPVGFGLRCNPYIHYILKAAGVKDASAKVWGSRTPINVIKTTLRMLWSGNAPLAMGNGIGGPAPRSMKGLGMRGAGDVERERGRKLVSLRT
ncbi:uncharacterized protein PHACADRAFT_251940 [Phanerochaete carnosa HHB-10118-sp]|uniref:S5 DRBM domain-containing protein n=1 Tax=Phanerochaete carnosa (strain HHB-10118-sp) TaxID=650164 RepID=K5WFX8_PHACS|nr:uncharacterized protein PHACADRAFT_251940 [Phanerochaete carnosa HHB-10118-sp]EKM57994.1 hypothetical protein PHACADRAFT_251940 [Phanerochaete carnosa HHB-10118-sp]